MVPAVHFDDICNQLQSQHNYIYLEPQSLGTRQNGNSILTSKDAWDVFKEKGKVINQTTGQGK